MASLRPTDAESWKRMVLQSMPVPGWLADAGPYSGVVLSTRVRFMRNLKGYRFPHRALDWELDEVRSRIIAATPPSFRSYTGLTNAERDYFVGMRLVSPDFPWTLPHRAVLMDRSSTLCLLINEEDHLRVQALSPGWSPTKARDDASAMVSHLAQHLTFAWNEPFGFLSASPYNCGEGRRVSAMFQLIGLAHTQRMRHIVKALLAEGFELRGLFGEASRPIGAFAQISQRDGRDEQFLGACEYLIEQEQTARNTCDLEEVRRSAEQARNLAISRRTLSLSDALRVIAWVRWASILELPGFPASYRDLDLALVTLDVRGTGSEDETAIRRADTLRRVVHQSIRPV